MTRCLHGFNCVDSHCQSKGDDSSLVFFFAIVIVSGLHRWTSSRVVAGPAVAFSSFCCSLTASIWRPSVLQFPALTSRPVAAVVKVRRPGSPLLDDHETFHLLSLSTSALVSCLPHMDHAFCISALLGP